MRYHILTKTAVSPSHRAVETNTFFCFTATTPSPQQLFQIDKVVRYVRHGKVHINSCNKTDTHLNCTSLTTNAPTTLNWHSQNTTLPSNFQRIPPHIYRSIAAERAIQTWKLTPSPGLPLAIHLSPSASGSISSPNATLLLTFFAHHVANYIYQPLRL